MKLRVYSLYIYISQHICKYYATIVRTVCNKFAGAQSARMEELCHTDGIYILKWCIYITYGDADTLHNSSPAQRSTAYKTCRRLSNPLPPLC